MQVHNTVVRGRCHLNVSAIIKKLPDDIPINVVVLRSEKNQEKIAVPEITQFPIFLDDVVRKLSQNLKLERFLMEVFSSQIFGSPEFGAYLSRREIKMKKVIYCSLKPRVKFVLRYLMGFSFFLSISSIFFHWIYVRSVPPHLAKIRTKSNGRINPSFARSF